MRISVGDLLECIYALWVDWMGLLLIDQKLSMLRLSTLGRPNYVE